MQISDVEQMLSDMEHGVYDLTDNGKCIECGSCCSNLLWLTQSEIKRIKNYISANHITESKRIFPTRDGTVLDLTCPFLDTTKKDKKCKIYRVRPKICKEFICDPKQRKKPDMKDYKGVILADIRRTFFREV